MSVQYRVYWNSGSGGPVDRSSPYLTTSALEADTPPLAAPGDYTFLVAPYDAASGLEDRTAGARVRVVLGPGGDDLTGLPGPPVGLSARPRASGSARVAWHDPPGSGAAGFRVYVWPDPGPPDYSAPAATVSARAAGGRAPTCLLAGLAGGAAYRVAVRAYNAAGEEANTSSAPLTAATAGPSPVASLTASAVP